MKKHFLVLAALVSTQCSLARTSYQVKDDISRQISTATGAFFESCSSYKNKSQYDSTKMIASSCYSTTKSMDTVKQYIDLYYSDDLIGGWHRYGHKYQNTIYLDDHMVEIVISPVDPDGKKVTFFLFTNIEAENMLIERQKKQDTVFSSLGYPRDTYNLGVHTKGVRYVDIMQNLDIFSLKKEGQYLNLTHAGNKLLFKFSSREAFLNGKPINLPGTPYLRGPFIFVPAIVVSQLGCKIVDPYFTESTIEADCGEDVTSLISVEKEDIWAH